MKREAVKPILTDEQEQELRKRIIRCILDYYQPLREAQLREARETSGDENDRHGSSAESDDDAA